VSDEGAHAAHELFDRGFALRLLSSATLSFGAVGSVLTALDVGGARPWFPLTLLSFATSALSLWVGELGKVRLGIRIYLAAFISIMLLIVLGSGEGVHSGYFDGGILATLLAGLLLSWRAATAVGVVHLGLLLAVYLAELAGLLPAPSLPGLTLFGFYVRAMTDLMILVFISVGLRRLAQSHDELEGRVRRRTRDLAEARDQAIAASQSRSDFLSNMSHEIRTPLNAVLGMAGLLLETDLDPRQQHFTRIVRRSGEQLLALINDILDLSKVDAGALQLEAIPLSVRDVVERSADLVAAPAADKGLELVYRVHDSVPACHRGDPTRLTQVLVNLLSNAVKFTEEGEVVLRVDLTAAGMLRMRVSDTGIGIPADVVPTLFDAFTQADSSTTRRFGGTGLGLAIVHRLVSLMGGRIGIDSTPGQGTTFSVELPLPPLEGHGVPQRQQLEQRHLQLLIVDDNATNREVVGQQLQGWGVGSTAAASAAEALALVQDASSFDGYLLDFSMPDVDGLELAIALRRRVGPTRPVLLLTSVSHVHSVLPEGVDAVVSKPVRPSTLLDLLVRFFGEQVAPTEPTDPSEPPWANAPLRILIVDDNQINQQLATLSLERFGLRADVASDGAEAVRAVTDIGYDLVFMDLQMPVMGGLEATHAIRALTDLQQPTIVAMTASATSEMRTACLDAGMDDFVPKPFSVDDLRHAIDRVIAQTGPPLDVAPPSLPPPPPVAADLDAAVLAGLAPLFAAHPDKSLSQAVADAVANFAQLIDDLETGARDGDLELVERSAHTLKSAGAMMGAARLAEVAATLEATASTGAMPDAQPIDLRSLLDAYRLAATAAAEAHAPTSST